MTNGIPFQELKVLVLEKKVSDIIYWLIVIPVLQINISARWPFELQGLSYSRLMLSRRVPTAQATLSCHGAEGPKESHEIGQNSMIVCLIYNAHMPANKIWIITWTSAHM